MTFTATTEMNYSICISGRSKCPHCLIKVGEKESGVCHQMAATKLCRCLTGFSSDSV